MIAVLQRVSFAKVVTDGECVAECGKGFLILLGVASDDCEEDARLLAEKISKLRVFQDDAGKMNLSVNDVSGGAVVVPNFTLLASYKKGNRPDFFNSAPPRLSKPLFEYFTNYLKQLVPEVTAGVFGADMKVSLCNDGPVTIHMDSKVLSKK
ncbi:MAG: D-tyrosyl-tRNA(Tyr) deacylase [Clostridia bacterium]|nr:D-tyrosyl-tRNA(Tyr) deacylase [Clostridia bacterium]